MILMTSRQKKIYIVMLRRVLNNKSCSLSYSSKSITMDKVDCFFVGSIAFFIFALIIGIKFIFLRG